MGNFSRFFIERPIFASVIAIIIALAGVIASQVLPVAQYPEIAPPTVTITASYPGASAETLAQDRRRAASRSSSPGVENMIYFSSSAARRRHASASPPPSRSAPTSTRAVFQLNNRVQIALPRLPDEVRRNGVTVQKRSNDILLVVGLLLAATGAQTTTFMADYATVNMVDELKRVPGVGDVLLFGSGYSMRVWLEPDRMARLGVTPTDVASAIRAQNAQYAAGKIGAEPAPPGQALVYTVTARGRLVTPEEFGDIVVRAGGPAGVLRVQGRRPRRARARRATTSPRPWTASPPSAWRSSCRRAPTRSTSPRRSRARLERAQGRVPRRHGLPHPVRHHAS